jgi:hypothetical protein
MALEEMREQLSQRFKDLGAKIQESPLFQSLKEKFDDLPSNQQKIVVLLLVTVISFFLFSFPYENWSTSSTSIVEFEDRRKLIRDLLKVTKESSELPAFPPAPELGQIKTDIELKLQSYQLIPEQMGGINVEMPSNSPLIPLGRQEGGIKVLLKKLNLRQIVDITSGLQSMQTAVKLKNLSIDSNLKDPRYLDAILDFVVIKIPQISMETNTSGSATDTAKPRGKKGRF